MLFHVTPFLLGTDCMSPHHLLPLCLAVPFRTQLIKSGVFEAMGSVLESYTNPKVGEYAAGTMDELSQAPMLQENQV